MKIVVVGCGKIGSTIIESLIAEGHDVVAVDNDPKVLREITDVFDVIGVLGSGCDYEVLQEAGISSAELYCAVTASDEVNMLGCFIAKKLGASHTIARIRNPEYNDKNLGFLRKELEISMAVNPEFTAACELFNIFKMPAAIKIETFSRRNFEMAELLLKPDSEILGHPLSELRKKIEAKFIICAVLRGDELIVPGGSFVLESGDKIVVTASIPEMQKLFKTAGFMQKQAKNIMLIGASRISYYLAKMLVAAGSSVKIIEPSRERCLEFCDLLPGVSMVEGSSTDQNVLLEEGIKSVDGFASLTGLDEENILLSFFATSQGVPKSVAKVNSDEFASLAVRLGQESLVSPKKIIADILVRYARALENSLGNKMETLYKVLDGRAEISEFNIAEESALTHTPIKDLKLKKGVLICGIIRDRKPIIPTGDDEIKPLDKVIVFSKAGGIKDIGEILK